MNIRKIRYVADSLFDQGKYEDAFYLYDEIYGRIWSAIGTVQNGLTDFSQSYLGSGFKASYEFKSNFTIQAADTIFKKWFNLDSDQTLNELTFTTFGHLQCICYSPILNTAISTDVVYNEFLIFHTLVLQSDKDDWISHLFKIGSPQLEDKMFRRFRYNLTDSTIKKTIIENAQKLKSTDWYNANVCFLDYLFNMGDNSSELYTSVHKVVGTYFRQKTHRKKSRTRDDEKRHEGKYESYERYEKYEKYERFEKSSSKSKEEFDATVATDFEKSKYYGQLLGLSGKVTKTYIRKKYLELIAKYHPDKVFDLGEELKILAEIKTKQLNAAYEYMKKKYNI